MEQTANNFHQVQVNQKTLEYAVHYNPSQQDDLIQMYLNPDVFYQQELQRISDHSTESPEKHQSKTHNPHPQSEETIVSAKEPKRYKKSIFHNFQKHLISTVKKYISFSGNYHGGKEGSIVLELWQAFMKTNSYNKRLLHTVFGVENAKKSTLDRLSQDFPQFRKIYTKHGWQRLLNAQETIRQSVVDQSSNISKFMVKSNSSIIKFQEFFSYYVHFISEISSGPMPKRMKKESKKSMLKSLKSRS